MCSQQTYRPDPQLDFDVILKGTKLKCGQMTSVVVPYSSHSVCGPASEGGLGSRVHPRATACLLAVPAPHSRNRGRSVFIPFSPDLISNVCRKIQVMLEEPLLLDVCVLDSPSSYAERGDKLWWLIMGLIKTFPRKGCCVQCYLQDRKKLIQGQWMVLLKESFPRNENLSRNLLLGQEIAEALGVGQRRNWSPRKRLTTCGKKNLLEELEAETMVDKGPHLLDYLWISLASYLNLRPLSRSLNVDLGHCQKCLTLPNVTTLNNFLLSLLK